MDVRDILSSWYLQYGTRDVDYFLVKDSTGVGLNQFIYMKNLISSNKEEI